MKMEARLQPRLEMKMKLSQHIIQSLQLLQVPMLELQRLVAQELAENPTLEVAQETDAPSDAEGEGSTSATTDAAADRMETLESLEDEWRESNKPSYDAAEYSNRKYDMMQNIESESKSLSVHLKDQIVMLEIPDDLRVIALQIVDSLDENGYLPLSDEEIAVMLADTMPNVPREELLPKIGAALAIVQTLEPRGVAARTLAETLVLQLSETDPNYAIKLVLIRQHMDNIAHNRMPKICRETNLTIEQLKQLIVEISSLKPRPGASYNSMRNPPIFPDVIVREIDGKYEAGLEDGFVPFIMINKNYQAMLKDKNLSKEEREYIQSKIESAKRMIGAIEHRKSTIYRIAQYIVNQQNDFFEKGMEYLKPLKMTDVAGEIGVHLSTVSRAIADKYMQTPRGIFPMKYFLPSAAQTDVPNKWQNIVNVSNSAATGLSSAVAAHAFDPSSPAQADGNNQTRISLLSKIKEIVEGEDKKNPINDADIARMLKQHSYNVARRTVAKYREELSIPSSKVRVQY